MTSESTDPYLWLEEVTSDSALDWVREQRRAGSTVPMLIITPLTFLGGAFYSIDMLPAGWRTVTLFNPVVYLISGFRWSFYEIADVSVGLSLGMTAAFLIACMVIVAWIFRTGYRLKN